MASDPLAVAQQLYEEKKYDDALQIFAAWVQPSEKSFYLWSRVYSRKDDFPNALVKADEGIVAFPASPDVHYARASALFHLKRHDEAAKECALIEKLDPSYGRARFLSAEILRGRAQYRSALAKYAEVLAHDPEFVTRESAGVAASYYNGWGNALLQLRRFAEAHEKYECAAKANPSLAVYWNNVGASELALERWSEAVEHYRMAEERDPEYVLMVKGLAQALARAGLPSEVQFEKALEMPPQDLWAPTMYATMLWRCGRYREAKRQACGLRDRYRTQRDTLIEEEKNEDFRDAALIFASMLDDFALAEDALSHATTRHQSPLDAADAQLTTASILLERCEREPNPPRAWRERAHAACRSALYEMRRHISASPNDAPPIDAEQQAMGRAYLALRDFKEAKPYLTKMPMREQSIDTLAARALLALELKDYPEAIAAAETALVRDPEDIANKLLLAEALLLGGELDRAETEVRDILQRAPGTVEAHQILAKVMLEQADKGDVDLYEQAMMELDRAWVLAGTANASKVASPAFAAAIHYLRGFARSKIYDDPKLAKDESLIAAARDDFRRCLTFDPQNHRALIALRKIEERLKPRSAGWLGDRAAGLVCGLISIIIFTIAAFGIDKGTLTPGNGAVFVFGALMFLIASFYLPYLLKLKVAGVELEKSAVDSSVSKLPLQIRKAPLQ